MENCFGRYYGRLVGRQTGGWRVTEGDLEELIECKNSNVQRFAVQPEFQSMRPRKYKFQLRIENWLSWQNFRAFSQTFAGILALIKPRMLPSTFVIFNYSPAILSIESV